MTTREHGRASTRAPSRPRRRVRIAVVALCLTLGPSLAAAAGVQDGNGPPRDCMSAAEATQSGDRAQSAEQPQSGDHTQSGDAPQSGDVPQSGDSVQSGDGMEAALDLDPCTPALLGDELTIPEPSEQGAGPHPGEAAQSGEGPQSDDVAQSGEAAQSGDVAQSGGKARSEVARRAGDDTQSGRDARSLSTGVALMAAQGLTTACAHAEKDSGAYADDLCWLDFEDPDAPATSAGKRELVPGPRHVLLPGGDRRISFTLSYRTVEPGVSMWIPESSTVPVWAPDTAGDAAYDPATPWHGAFFGRPAGLYMTAWGDTPVAEGPAQYTGIPVHAAVNIRHSAVAYRVDLADIVLEQAEAGEWVRSEEPFELVVVDAESTDPVWSGPQDGQHEYIDFFTTGAPFVPMVNKGAAAGDPWMADHPHWGTACNATESGVSEDGLSARCRVEGGQRKKTGSMMLTAPSPAAGAWTLSVEARGQGEQAFAVAVGAPRPPDQPDPTDPPFDPVVPALPLTGGPATDAFLITGAVVAAAGLVAGAQTTRRPRRDR